MLSGMFMQALQFWSRILLSLLATYRLRCHSLRSVCVSLGVEKVDLMFHIFMKFNDVLWNLFCHASWAGGSLNFRAALALVMIFTDASLRSVGIPDIFHPFGCGKTL